MTIVPNLVDLLVDPTKVALVPPEAVAGMRGKLAELDTLLLGRLLGAVNGQGQMPSEGDRLLDVEQAAAKLNISTSELYRHAKEYPFYVPGLGHRLRFSDAAIEKYIRQRTGNNNR